MARIRIFQPTKTATQSGKAKTHQWTLEFETGDPLNAEPLMGWSSSRDTRRQLRLRFDTLDEALAYAKGTGLQYTIYNPTLRKTTYKDYGANFTNPRVRG